MYDALYESEDEDNCNKEPKLFEWQELIYDRPTGPSTRNRHAACCHDGSIYIHGGRYGGSSYRDIWEYNTVTECWSKLSTGGEVPAALRDHTLTAHDGYLYAFGGEFSSTVETPMWILDLDLLKWKKMRFPGMLSPLNRRGHTAVCYNNSVYFYGGFLDILGSSCELWSFNFESQSWKLCSGKESKRSMLPLGRHDHSAVIHNRAMWVYGGMSNLQPRSDFWRWEFDVKKWYRVKSFKGPPELSGHTASKVGNCMYLIGGISKSELQRDVWSFNFRNMIWQRIYVPDNQPCTRTEHTVTTMIKQSQSMSGQNQPTNQNQTDRTQSVPTLKSSKTNAQPHAKRPYSSPASIDVNDTNGRLCYNKVHPIHLDEVYSQGVTNSACIAESPDAQESDKQLKNSDILVVEKQNHRASNGLYQKNTFKSSENVSRWPNVRNNSKVKMLKSLKPLSVSTDSLSPLLRSTYTVSNDSSIGKQTDQTSLCELSAGSLPGLPCSDNGKLASFDSLQSIDQQNKVVKLSDSNKNFRQSLENDLFIEDIEHLTMSALNSPENSPPETISARNLVNSRFSSLNSQSESAESKNLGIELQEMCLQHETTLDHQLVASEVLSGQKSHHDSDKLNLKFNNHLKELTNTRDNFLEMSSFTKPSTRSYCIYVLGGQDQGSQNQYGKPLVVWKFNVVL